MELMNNWRKRMSERRAIRRLVALLAVGGVSMAMMGEALAAEPEAAKPAETAETPKYMLEDVVVTAERIPTKRMDTPANVSVITAEEIEDNHYKDVAEALSHINGVVVSSGNSNQDSSVRLNGDERVVVLVDGRRLNNDQGSMTRESANLNMLPSMKNIERIEVIKGGGSALYGSDAVGGVINIITKKGEELTTTIDLSAGTGGLYNYEISHGGSEKDFSWFVTGGLQRRSYMPYIWRGDSQAMPNSDFNNNSFSLRVDGKIDDSSSTRINFEHRSIDGGLYANAGRQEELFNNVSLSYQFKENTKTPGYLRVYSHYKKEDYLGEFDTETRGVDYQNGWQLGKNNTLIAGAEWRRSTSSNAQSGYVDKEIENVAVYLQDTWKFADKWSLVPGLRMDNHNMFGVHWTPKVALNYNANDKTQVYASWGRVFKAPTADDLYYTVDWSAIGWGTYTGNPNLRPETGYTASVGITHKFNEKSTIAAHYFYSELHDAIHWATTNWNDYYVTNFTYERKRGFEISYSQDINKQFSFDLGYSYIHVESVENVYGNNPMIAGRNMQPNGYRAGIHFHQGPWKANLSLTAGAGLDRIYYQERNYTLLDFNLSYEVIKGLDLYFKANNLTNQEYQRYPGNNLNLAGPGRVFQFGVTYTF